MVKRIVSIGFGMPGDKVGYIDLYEKASLLDWDIILFRPTFDVWASDSYQGKPALNDERSFSLREACNHWKREFSDAVASGKTVVIFLSKMEECFIATGEKQHSGTGRNRSTTRIVTEYSNYESLPKTADFIATNGKRMRLDQKATEEFGPYWNSFGEMSEFNVLLDGKDLNPTIVTQDGSKIVGSHFFSKTSGGKLLYLPDLEFSKEEFFVDDDEEKMIWSKAAVKFFGALIKSLVELDNSLGSKGERSPTPEWAHQSDYVLKVESDLRSELFAAEAALEYAKSTKSSIEDALQEAGLLRSLLFEKGKQLELAILEALRSLGFSAENLTEGESEFDAVFQSIEGRLLGEAEGKDSCAISITKLRQLAMNIYEDLLRDEVKIPAKGVLFGNGFRLHETSSREQQFTPKCVSAAVSQSIALVSTSDLFRVARYCSENDNPEYAEACRRSLIEQSGLVNFPSLPEVEVYEEARMIDADTTDETEDQVNQSWSL